MKPLALEVRQSNLLYQVVSGHHTPLLEVAEADRPVGTPLPLTFIEQKRLRNFSLFVGFFLRKRM